ncbi:snake venom 5'-nucleotidase-like [Amblyomma americanum]
MAGAGIMVSALVILFFLCACCLAQGGNLTLTVMHTNDVHAHIEESTKYGAMCSKQDKANESCVGGVARITTKVKELKAQYPGALFINAGDFFQGTAWYTVLKQVIISTVMSKMGYDYVCLGNHEFDDGPAGLAPFLVAMREANVTVVNTNANFSNEPLLRNISLPTSVKLNISGTQVGIVGAVLPETRVLSMPGLVEFDDDLESIKKEALKLDEEGVKIIIAITHSGYPRDLEIVEQVPQIDLLVGGHTNTFLYHGDGYPQENTKEGDYPTLVNRSDSSLGLVVQDYWFGKFLGFLQVSFDKDGKVVNWTGNPILLNSSVKEDEGMLDIISCYKDNVTRAFEEVIGYSKVLLEQADNICRLRECNLGNLIADSYFAYYADMESRDPDHWSNVNGALLNGGAIRAPIPQMANITMGHILTTMPFGQSVVIMTLNGSELRDMFEHSVKNYSFRKRTGQFLQVSGIRVTYNVNMTAGCRVVSLQVLCRRCKVPLYEDVEDDKTYRIATIDYVTRGGDGYKKATNATSGGPADYTVLVDYIKKMSPVKAALEGRITVLNGTERVTIPGDTVTNPSLLQNATLSARILSYYTELQKYSQNIFHRLSRLV